MFILNIKWITSDFSNRLLSGF